MEKMISSIVLTKNEEENISRCLKSLSWCDEILVVDDYSEDKTADVAKKYGGRVLKRKLNGDFSQQRNFGLDKASGDWVLFIDADEVVTKELAEEIQKITKSPQVGFRIKRQTVMWERKLTSQFERESPLRLAKKDGGRWRRKVHEVWDVRGEIGTLKQPLLHYSHKTLSEFLKDINFYSTLHAQALSEEGKKSSVFKIIIWPVGKFFEVWIKKQAFRDGTIGFVISGMMSFHSFLAWSKLYLKKQ